MAFQNAAGACGEAGEHFPAQFHGHVDGEALGQQQDVARTLAQRRQGDDIESQPIQQVVPEAAGPRQPGQILVGGGDQAHIAMQGLAPAHPLELAVLDDPQQLLLHQGRSVRQFVQKQGAAIRPLEPPLMDFGGAGVGADLVAEQLVFQQGVGNGGAVQLQELPPPALGKVMQPLGDQFLARAPLPDDEHGLLQGGDLGHLFQNPQKGGGFAQQPVRFGAHGRQFCQ